MFKHREISHDHILGTVTRVLFMGLWMLPLIPWLMLTIDWKIVALHCGLVSLGLTVTDSMHTPQMEDASNENIQSNCRPKDPYAHLARDWSSRPITSVDTQTVSSV